MKPQIILTGFVILTLLIGFSSGNFVNQAFADEDVDRADELKEREEKFKEEKKDRSEKYMEELKERMEKYKEEEKEKMEKYKEEHEKRIEQSKKELQERMDKYREETGDKLEKYRDELREKHEKYRDEIKTHENKIKSKYNLLKNIYNDKFDGLKNQLKDQLRDLKFGQLATSDSSEISEDDILALEDKRIQLELLKRDFREKIKDLKTQARQDISAFKQDYIKHDQERSDKIHDKLNDIKLKYKDRIKEHKNYFFEVILSSYSPTDPQYFDRYITMCHKPPGNPDNAHTIKVGSEAGPAHYRHGDSMGACGNYVLDEIIEDLSEQFEYKVRAETLGEQSEVKLELEFVTETTSYEAIVLEIIENFALNIEDANELLKIQQEDDEELEEKFEIEIEYKDGYSEVEVELRFILDSTDRTTILDAIVARSQLDTGLVKIGLENEIGDDEDDDDEDDEDDEEDD